MAEEESCTPVCDEHEVDVSQAISTRLYPDGHREIVQKYIPSYVARGLEVELRAIRKKFAKIKELVK